MAFNRRPSKCQICGRSYIMRNSRSVGHDDCVAKRRRERSVARNRERRALRKVVPPSAPLGQYSDPLDRARAHEILEQIDRPNIIAANKVILRWMRGES
jgi:hypothetical protein